MLMDRVILPGFGRFRSSPRKSLGITNLHLKYFFISDFNFSMALGWPAMRESSTYWMRKHSPSGVRYRKRQGSVGHWVKPICLSTVAV